MERYAVLNVGSGEILSLWHTTEEAAHADAAEAESHETQPDCNVVRFSEWAPGRRLSELAGERWEGQHPLVTCGPDGSLAFTGEIVSAQSYPLQESGCTVTECGCAAYKRGG